MGEILVRKGYLSIEQVKEALGKQAEAPPEARLPLGQVLLDDELISDDQLLECLEIQRRLAQRAPSQSS